MREHYRPRFFFFSVKSWHPEGKITFWLQEGKHLPFYLQQIGEGMYGKLSTP
jgi:hypothetical protein